MAAFARLDLTADLVRKLGSDCTFLLFSGRVPRQEREALAAFIASRPALQDIRRGFTRGQLVVELDQKARDRVKIVRFSATCGRWQFIEAVAHSADIIRVDRYIVEIDRVSEVVQISGVNGMEISYGIALSQTDFFKAYDRIGNFVKAGHRLHQIAYGQLLPNRPPEHHGFLLPQTYAILLEDS